MEGYWIWCGSVIKGEDDRFHMFASRWPKHVPMHPGWLVASEVVRAVSDTPEGYALIAKDMNGNICGEKHAGIHAFSKDGLD